MSSIDTAAARRAAEERRRAAERARKEAAERARKEAARRAAAEARRKEAARVAAAAKAEQKAQVEKTRFEGKKLDDKVELRCACCGEGPKSAGELRAYKLATDELRKLAKAGGSKLTAGEARELVAQQYDGWVKKAGKDLDEGATLAELRRSFLETAGAGPRPSGDKGGPGTEVGGPLRDGQDIRTRPDILKALVDKANRAGVPPELLFMTIGTESSFRQTSGGDRDSVGLFQQRESWGSFAERMDPLSAADKFLAEAVKYKGQYGSSAAGLGQWAQAVQRSAFPDRYQTQYDEARRIVALAEGSPVPAATEVGGARAAKMPWEVGLQNGRIPAERMQEIGVGSHRLWEPAAEAYKKMVAAAKADGVTWGITDSYRSYEVQVDLVRRKGLYSQGGLAATPGTSQHGWGLAVDLDLGSEAQAWMQKNAARFGFGTIPREPWHWEFDAKGATSAPTGGGSSAGAGTSGGAGASSGGGAPGVSGAGGPSGISGGGGGSSGVSGAGSSSPSAPLPPPFEASALDRSLARSAGVDWDTFFSYLLSYFEQMKGQLTKSNPEFRKWLEEKGWKPGQPITNELKAEFLAEKLSGATKAAGGGEKGLAKAAKKLGIPEFGDIPKGQVGDWIRQAMTILRANGVPVEKMNPQDIALIIERESGGNPNAQNNWDSNAAKGTPSIGLMQTIGPTFDAHKLPGHGNIRNPVDNIIAGVRYAVSRYGSVSNVPGVRGVRNGTGYVGY